MYDFELITARHWRHSPLAAREDFEISLDGQAIRGEPEVLHELRHVPSSGYFAWLAIDFYGQRPAHD